jgi:hypothetical protein
VVAQPLLMQDESSGTRGMHAMQSVVMYDLRVDGAASTIAIGAIRDGQLVTRRPPRARRRPGTAGSACGTPAQRIAIVVYDFRRDSAGRHCGTARRTGLDASLLPGWQEGYDRTRAARQREIGAGCRRSPAAGSSA